MGSEARHAPRPQEQLKLPFSRIFKRFPAVSPSDVPDSSTARFMKEMETDHSNPVLPPGLASFASDPLSEGKLLSSIDEILGCDESMRLDPSAASKARSVSLSTAKETGPEKDGQARPCEEKPQESKGDDVGHKYSVLF